MPPESGYQPDNGGMGSEQAFTGTLPHFGEAPEAPLFDERIKALGRRRNTCSVSCICNAEERDIADTGGVRPRSGRMVSRRRLVYPN